MYIKINRPTGMKNDLLEQMCLLLEQCGTGAQFQMGMKTT